MTNHNMHCESCLKRYGYPFSEIHSWMDEPATINGPKHRMFRHDETETPKMAEELFLDKIPEQYRKYIREAVLDHLIIDTIETRIKKRTTTVTTTVSVQKEDTIEDIVEPPRRKIRFCPRHKNGPVQQHLTFDSIINEVPLNEL